MFTAALSTRAKGRRNPNGHRWPMDKQDGADTFKGMKFSLTKEGHSDTYSSMDELEHIMLRNKPTTKRLGLMGSPWSSQVHGDRKKYGTCQGWEEEGTGNSGLMQLLFNGYRVVVLYDGERLTTRQCELLNTTELKKDDEGKFYVLCILPQFLEVWILCVNMV